MNINIEPIIFGSQNNAHDDAESQNSSSMNVQSNPSFGMPWSRSSSTFSSETQIRLRTYDYSSSSCISSSNSDYGKCESYQFILRYTFMNFTNDIIYLDFAIHLVSIQ